MGAGENEHLIEVTRKASDSSMAEVEEDGFAEGEGLAGDDFGGVIDGDEEGHASGLGVAEAEEETSVREGGEAFDVQGVARFWRERGGAAQVEGREARVGEEVADEAGGRRTDGLDGRDGGVGEDAGGEEAVAAGAEEALPVPAMGGDPEDRIAGAGGGLDVDLGVRGVDAEESGQVEGPGRHSPFIRVDAEDVVLVIGDDGVVGAEGEDSGGVAASAVEADEAG